MKNCSLLIIIISFISVQIKAQEFCVNISDDELIVDQFEEPVNVLMDKMRELTLQNDSMNLISLQTDGIIVEMIFSDKETGWFKQSKWRTIVKMAVVFSVNEADSGRNDMRVSITASEGIIGNKRVREVKKNREGERLNNYRTSFVNVINQHLRS